MKRFPMKRKTKYAFRSYSFPSERDYKSDRQHMWSKWRKKYMRLFIKREAEEEISEELKERIENGLKWLYESEERESERMREQYLGK